MARHLDEIDVGHRTVVLDLRLHLFVVRELGFVVDIRRVRLDELVEHGVLVVLPKGRVALPLVEEHRHRVERLLHRLVEREHALHDIRVLRDVRVEREDHRLVLVPVDILRRAFEARPPHPPVEALGALDGVFDHLAEELLDVCLRRGQHYVRRGQRGGDPHDRRVRLRRGLARDVQVHPELVEGGVHAEGESLEDELLPVRVVVLHRWGPVRVRPCHNALDLPHLLLDRAVLVEKTLDGRGALPVDDLVELLHVHGLLAVELPGVDEVRVHDRDHHRLDVRRRHLHLLEHGRELVDVLGAALEVLLDRQRVPVQRIEPEPDRRFQVLELVVEELLLRGGQRADHRVVVRQHHFQRLRVRVVLLLLESDVEGVLRDGEAHAVQVASLADHSLEVARKVDVDHVVVRVFGEDGRFEVLDHRVLDPCLPAFEQPVFKLADHAADEDVVLGHELALVASHHVLVRLEADDRLLDPEEERLGPCDSACDWRLVLEGRGVLAVLLE
mmetsp:Transcript_36345/g.86018  ORF Transcript_36345/g.86018 Transcript_36345/m.86018 type:complete len:501 (-) Transcript_36345:1586-3088(-)